MNLFDSHFHIINPAFPLVENQGYLPPTFLIEDYLQQVEHLNIVGGAIVSGSFQTFDQAYLLDALKKLGKQFFGVANIPASMSMKELKRLDKAGITAVRFNLKRGGSESSEHLKTLSPKLYHELGWHTELYVDSKDLKDLSSQLKKIPLFSIDHLGLSKEGLKDLYRWVEKGVKIKATGFGRIDFDPIPVMRKIYDLNPDALLFGTDLPSTRAKVPFSDKDVALIRNNFSEKEQEKIFFENAKIWYGKKG